MNVKTSWGKVWRSLHMHAYCRYRFMHARLSSRRWQVEWIGLKRKLEGVDASVIVCTLPLSVPLKLGLQSSLLLPRRLSTTTLSVPVTPSLESVRLSLRSLPLSLYALWGNSASAWVTPLPAFDFPALVGHIVLPEPLPLFRWLMVTTYWFLVSRASPLSL